MSLNLDEMAQRANVSDENIRKPERWVPQLDKALKEGIVKIGTQNLIPNRGKLLFGIISILGVNAAVPVSLL